MVVVCYLMTFGLCVPCWFSHHDVEYNGGDFETAKTVNYAIAASLFNFGWAAVQVSHMALVPELTVDEGERVLLNSARYAFTIISNVTVRPLCNLIVCVMSVL